MLFQYTFFQYAMAAVALISVIAGVLGCYVMSRRLVSLAGGVTHACFAGLGIGCFFGWNPLWPAAAAAVASSLAVDGMSRREDVRADSATAVVWGAGMAIGVLFVFLTPGYVPELNAFLFGNILTVSRFDLWVTALFTLVMLAYCLLRRRVIVAVAFDSDFARVSRLHATRVNIIMSVLTALGIVLTIRLAGVMLLMSTLTFPAMAAERLTRRLPRMVPTAAAICLVAGMGALMLATVVNVPVSALMVMLLALIYLLTFLLTRRC